MKNTVSHSHQCQIRLPSPKDLPTGATFALLYWRATTSPKLGRLLFENILARFVVVFSTASATSSQFLDHKQTLHITYIQTANTIGIRCGSLCAHLSVATFKIVDSQLRRHMTTVGRRLCVTRYLALTPLCSEAY